MNLAQPALALGEISDGTILAYIGALAVSGFALLLVSALPIGTPSNTRVINVLLAAAMLGYAVYLLFLEQGGTVFIFWYVFVLPVVLVFRTFKSAKANREAKREAAAQRAAADRAAAFQAPAPGQPVQGQPAPGYPAAGEPSSQPSGAYYPPNQP
jgi:hypothetical protein